VVNAPVAVPELKAVANKQPAAVMKPPGANLRQLVEQVNFKTVRRDKTARREEEETLDGLLGGLMADSNVRGKSIVGGKFFSKKQKEEEEEEEEEEEKEEEEKDVELTEFLAEKNAVTLTKENLLLELEELNRLEQDLGRPDDAECGSSFIPQLFQKDFSKVVSDLDKTLDELGYNSLRPTILNVGKKWKRSRQTGLLGATASETLEVEVQKREKNQCFDLLDALTQSGGLDICDAELHIVIANTHIFSKNLMDTLVMDNVNPIEKLDRSLGLVTEAIHGKKQIIN
jgi:hypothetical protein